jgi:hypothetical protein
VDVEPIADRKQNYTGPDELDVSADLVDVDASGYACECFGEDQGEQKQPGPQR